MENTTNNNHNNGGTHCSDWDMAERTNIQPAIARNEVNSKVTTPNIVLRAWFRITRANDMEYDEKPGRFVHSVNFESQEPFMLEEVREIISHNALSES